MRLPSGALKKLKTEFSRLYLFPGIFRIKTFLRYLCFLPLTKAVFFAPSVQIPVPSEQYPAMI